jgi:hypothetical protein
MFKKIKMWFEKRKGEKKSSIENVDNQRLIIEKGAVYIDKPGQKSPYLIGYQELPTANNDDQDFLGVGGSRQQPHQINPERFREVGVMHLKIPKVKPPLPTAPAQPPQQKVVNNYVSITIDGKTYDTSNQEEIAEILKYFSEQLRAKK